MESSAQSDWFQEVVKLKEDYLRKQTIAKTLQIAAQAATAKLQEASQAEREAEKALLRAVIPEAFTEKKED